ncbi:MAG: right-handed parallel beta-helix repeat-containing protein, partial [Planctomycetaceae bacterium]
MAFQRRRKSTRQTDSSQQLEERCLLSTITVTSLADNMDVDGEVTLREAVHAANTNTSVDGSTAGSGGDKIVFDPSLQGGVIDLDLGQIEIDGAVEIVGRDTRIDAGSESRIFEITTAGSVALKELVLRNGFHTESGGAILAGSGRLTIADSKLVDNTVRGDADELTGGAVHASNFYSKNVIFRRNSVEYTGSGTPDKSVSGGAVHADKAVIRRSTFEANSSDGVGGGLTLTGSFEVKDSAISDNTAPLGGAGLFVFETSDLEHHSSSWVLQRSTVENNEGVGVSVHTTRWVSIIESLIAGNSSHGVEVQQGAETPIFFNDSRVVRNGGNGVSIAPSVEAGPNVYRTEISENAQSGIFGATRFVVDESTISGNDNGAIRARFVEQDFGIWEEGFRLNESTISGNRSEDGPAAIGIDTKN